MNEEKIKNIIFFLVKKLVEKNYKIIYDLDVEKRVSIEDMKRVIELEYLGILTLPPKIAFDKIFIYKLDYHQNQYRADFNLWFDDLESDLVLLLLINISKNVFSIEDIRVL